MNTDLQKKTLSLQQAVPSGKILLHVCCAPCASACVERLLAENRACVLYFSNSNLTHQEEYEKRLACVRLLADHYSLPLLVDPYDHEAWRTFIGKECSDYANQPERGLRCQACFAYSLGRTARKAEELALPFCTSLTVSPHKNSKVIFEIGSRYGNFECWDFKKKDGFKRSLQLSAEFGFYRQNFCGCEYSLRDTIQKNTRQEM